MIHQVTTTVWWFSTKGFEAQLRGPGEAEKGARRSTRHDTRAAEGAAGRVPGPEMWGVVVTFRGIFWNLFSIVFCMFTRGYLPTELPYLGKPREREISVKQLGLSIERGGPLPRTRNLR